MSASLYARYVPPKSSTGTNNGSATIVESQPKIAPTKQTIKEPKRPKKRKLDEAGVAQDENDNKVRRSKKHETILKKFDKSIKVSEKIRELVGSNDELEGKTDEDVELHDLVPLPQPLRTKHEQYKPNFTFLPSWISKPIIVDSQTRKPFSELGLSKKVLENLEKRGLHDSFPVQSALLPLQLPGIHRYHGDICVSAPTGSGKTLGYILPLIEGLKNKVATHLIAVIVVPTRELVIQARHEAEQCVAGTKIRIGTALGSTNLASEREHLILRDQRYDPEKAAEIRKIVKERLETGFMEDDTLLEDVRGLLPHHVPEFHSKVDILICTPGRLVEHIRSTTGFSLCHVKHLIIDEADRLLDESFQDWVDVIISALETDSKRRVGNEASMSSRLLRQPRYVHKVILSATMTRDLAKLAALKLKRPTLVAVVGVAEVHDDLESGEVAEHISSTELLELPSSLKEVAIPVGDGAEKPLYLLRLLDTELNFHGAAPGVAQEPISSSKIPKITLALFLES